MKAKKLLAALLSVLIVLMMVPVTALAVEITPPAGTTVWLTTTQGDRNVPYRYSGADAKKLIPVDKVFSYNSTEDVTFYAGTPYIEDEKLVDGKATVSLLDQTNPAAIDCWMAEGTGSTNTPNVSLVFHSRLAKVSLVIDASGYGDADSVSVKALNVPISYQFSPDSHTFEVPSTSSTGNIELTVTKLEDGKWLAEALLAPGTVPEFSITCGSDTKTVSLASYFTSGFSAEMVYSAELTYNADNWTVNNAKAEARGTWNANYKDLYGFIEVGLMPTTICGTGVHMEQPDDSWWEITPETALKGKVTVSPDVEKVQMKDLFFATRNGDKMEYIGEPNQFSFCDFTYYVFFQTSGSSEWSTQPVVLTPGETTTVLIKIDGEYQAYYSIDIIRPDIGSVITASSALNFGSVTEGYTAAPAAQTVTVTNTGNQTVTLNQPTAQNYEIGTLSKTVLAPNDTATFTVQPKAALPVGNYQEVVSVSGTDNASTSVTLDFVVAAKPAPTVSVTGVTLNTNTLSLDEGASETLTATVQPTDATNKGVTWSSNNTSVATVENGTVTAVKEGVATITVKTTDGGYSASCTVTVNKPAPTEVIITFDPTGGYVPYTTAVTHNGRLTELPIATRYGYTFTGWYTVNGIRVSTDMTFTGNVTLYAGWIYNGIDIPEQPVKPVQPQEPEYEWISEDGGTRLYYDGKMITGWYQDEETEVWYWLDTDTGFRASAQWVKIDGNWYLFDKDGSMLTGWQKVDGKWYYLKPWGGMATGWQYIDNVWYYLRSDGSMAGNAWVMTSGQWYYLTGSGEMATNKWIQWNGDWYFLYSSGVMATNTTIDGYTINSAGVWVK